MDKSFFDYARYGSIGIAWVLSTVIYTYLGFAGGQWLDRRINSEPVFLVIGLLMAVALSLRSLVVEVLTLIDDSGGKQKKKRLQDAESGESRESQQAGMTQGSSTHPEETSTHKRD